MPFALRPYQELALNVLHQEIQTKDILLLQAATGAGKTVIIVRLINRYFFDHPGRKFLILMHKQELVAQFAASFAKFSEIPEKDIGFACSGYSSKVLLDRRVTIASVQTLVNRMDEYGGADLVIVDETHRVTDDEDTQYGGLLAKLREYRPGHKVLGVTATAFRLGHGYIYGDQCRPGRTNFFPELTHRIKYQELRDAGHLMPLVARIAADENITADLANVQVSGDYNLGQLGDTMSKTVHVQSAVDGLEEYGSEHKRVCVFACTIAHCEALAEAFRERGHSVTTIHSKLSPIERESNMIAWRSGRVRIAVSVNILVEGFDFPELSCLVFCRPTKSPTLFIQALGRILRTAPDKDEALLIDLTDNTRNFGKNLDEPNFTIPGFAEGEGEAPTKTCPGELADGSFCGELVHASLFYCPFCGYEFERPEAVEAELPDLKKVEFNKKEPPEPYDVSSVDYEIHESKKSGKFLIKVTYRCGLNLFFNEWICLPDFYKGYAVAKAEAWWAERTDEDFPSSVEEFIFLSGCLATPLQVLVVEDGKYNRVEGAVWTHEPIVDDDLPPLEPGWKADPDDCSTPF